MKTLCGVQVFRCSGSECLSRVGRGTFVSQLTTRDSGVDLRLLRLYRCTYTVQPTMVQP